MQKERRFTLTGLTSFLLIVCWMMAIHLIRSSDAIPVSSDESESSVDQDDQSKTDEFLNAIEELVGRLDEASIPMARHEHPDTWAAVTKREESPVSSGGISRTAIGVHSRSALNKNFIRFGRSGGYQPRRALAIEKLRRALLEKSDSDTTEDSFANFSHFPRSSRGLQSNFIRFGRSVPSSNRS